MLNVKKISIALLLLSSQIVLAQQKPPASIDTGWNQTLINTAKNETYMTEREKQMMEEINRLRSNPKKYCELFIQPLLKGAKELIEQYGNGEKNIQ